ncbi:MAG: hypothetical protein ACOZNI_26900 [Myxococcota bacterium]
MARPRMTQAKRAREQQRQERGLAKLQDRAERKKAKGERSVADGVDPDIAHIIPGPQPREDEDED